MKNKNEADTKNTVSQNNNPFPSGVTVKSSLTKKRLLIAAIVTVSFLDVALLISISLYLKPINYLASKDKTSQISPQLTTGLATKILKLYGGFYKLLPKGDYNKLIPLGNAPTANKKVIQEAKDLFFKEEGMELRNVSGGAREPLPNEFKSAAVLVQEQQQLVESGTKLADYVTELHPQVADEQLNYIIGGSEGTTILSKADSFTEIRIDTLGNIVEMGVREIPDSARSALNSFARPINDLDYIVAKEGFELPGLSKTMSVNNGIPYEKAYIPSGDMPSEAKTIIKDPMGLSFHNNESIYGETKAAKVTVNGKDYYVSSPDDALAYKTLDAAIRYGEKPEQFKSDIGKIFEATKGIYSEEELLNTTGNVLGNFRGKWKNGQQFTTDGIEKILADGQAPEVRDWFDKVKGRLKADTSLITETGGNTISKSEELSATAIAGFTPTIDWTTEETIDQNLNPAIFGSNIFQIPAEVPVLESAPSFSTGGVNMLNLANRVNDAVMISPATLGVGAALLSDNATLAALAPGLIAANAAILAPTTIFAGAVAWSAVGYEIYKDPEIINFLKQDIDSAYRGVTSWVTNPQATDPTGKSSEAVAPNKEQIFPETSALEIPGDSDQPVTQSQKFGSEGLLQRAIDWWYGPQKEEPKPLTDVDSPANIGWEKPAGEGGSAKQPIQNGGQSVSSGQSQPMTEPDRQYREVEGFLQEYQKGLSSVQSEKAKLLMPPEAGQYLNGYIMDEEKRKEKLTELEDRENKVIEKIRVTESRMGELYPSTSKGIKEMEARESEAWREFYSSKAKLPSQEGILPEEAAPPQEPMPTSSTSPPPSEPPIGPQAAETGNGQPVSLRMVGDPPGTPPGKEGTMGVKIPNKEGETVELPPGWTTKGGETDCREGDCIFIPPPGDLSDPYSDLNKDRPYQNPYDLPTSEKGRNSGAKQKITKYEEQFERPDNNDRVIYLKKEDYNPFLGQAAIMPEVKNDVVPNGLPISDGGGVIQQREEESKGDIEKLRAIIERFPEEMKGDRSADIQQPVKDAWPEDNLPSQQLAAIRERFNGGDRSEILGSRGNETVDLSGQNPEPSYWEKFKALLERDFTGSETQSPVRQTENPDRQAAANPVVQKYPILGAEDNPYSLTTERQVVLGNENRQKEEAMREYSQDQEIPPGEEAAKKDPYPKPYCHPNLEFFDGQKVCTVDKDIMDEPDDQKKNEKLEKAYEEWKKEQKEKQNKENGKKQ